MCLSIPSQVVSFEAENIAIVDTMGVQRQVNLDLMPEPVEEGDYVLIHVGFAMNKIDKADALASIELYQQILQKMGEEEGSQ